MGETQSNPHPRASLSLVTRAEHANAFGTVHGGVILRLADEAGALAALHHAIGKVITTAAVDSFAFLGPVQVAERLEAVGQLTYAGRTSLEVRVVVYSEPFATFERRKIGEGYLVYVVLDREGKPTPVDALPRKRRPTASVTRRPAHVRPYGSPAARRRAVEKRHRPEPNHAPSTLDDRRGNPLDRRPGHRRRAERVTIKGIDRDLGETPMAVKLDGTLPQGDYTLTREGEKSGRLASVIGEGEASYLVLVLDRLKAGRTRELYAGSRRRPGAEDRVRIVPQGESLRINVGGKHLATYRDRPRPQADPLSADRADRGGPDAGRIRWKGRGGGQGPSPSAFVLVHPRQGQRRRLLVRAAGPRHDPQTSRKVLDGARREYHPHDRRLGRPRWEGRLQ